MSGSLLENASKCPEVSGIQCWSGVRSGRCPWGAWCRDSKCHLSECPLNYKCEDGSGIEADVDRLLRGCRRGVFRGEPDDDLGRSAPVRGMWQW